MEPRIAENFIMLIAGLVDLETTYRTFSGRHDASLQELWDELPWEARMHEMTRLKMVADAMIHANLIRALIGTIASLGVGARDALTAHMRSYGFHFETGSPLVRPISHIH